MTILDEIIAHKCKEISAINFARETGRLLCSPLMPKKTKSLSESIINVNKTGIIAEFKRKSPSKGVINDTHRILDVTSAYEKAGASALSILTNTEYFGGTNVDLFDVAIESNIPILRKEFIVSEFQIIESRAIGADAILLIAAALSAADIKHFCDLAHDFGMEVLLEVCCREDLDKYYDKVDVVGVNNRNLHDFSVDVNRSLELLELLPKDKVLISESGFSDPAKARLLKDAGFQGFLIGESFMKEQDPGKACSEFAKNAGLINL
jgi:indole-3-glycerol phosphate synthase